MKNEDNRISIKDIIKLINTKCELIFVEDETKQYKAKRYIEVSFIEDLLIRRINNDITTKSK